MKRAQPPDRDAALDQYRRRAAVYDLELAAFEPIRRLAVTRLALRPGEVVLDVGCGTGLSLALLHDGVSAGAAAGAATSGRSTGHVVGIEQSPEMIERARQRLAQHGWRNVTLVNAPVDGAVLPLQADAALFHFTHDILRQPRALAHVVAHLKPGARVVAAGLKWSAGLAWPVNALVLPAALRSVTTLEGLARPWDHLQALTSAPRLESAWWGAVYIASAMQVPLAGRPSS